MSYVYTRFVRLWLVVLVCAHKLNCWIQQWWRTSADTTKECHQQTTWTSRRDVWAAVRPHVALLVVISSAISFLMLGGSLYMLQIYDRVLPSNSVEALIVFTIMLTAVFGFLWLLDHYRGRIGAHVGVQVQQQLDPHQYDAAVAPEQSEKVKKLRDVEGIQTYLSSPVSFAVFDIPWTPVFIAVIYSFHVYLGHFAVFAFVLLIGLALYGQKRTRPLEARAAKVRAASDEQLALHRAGRETIAMLGAGKNMWSKWRVSRTQVHEHMLTCNDQAGWLSTLSKYARQLLQSAMLGVGAYVVMRGEMSPGAMIAGSILLGRALAPVDLLINGWPVVQRAWRGWQALPELFAEDSHSAPRTELPRPRAHLRLDQVTVMNPEGNRALLRIMSFEVEPGQVLFVYGSNGSGKTTLAKVLAGLITPAAGRVTLDGADLSMYGDQLHEYVGVVPQVVALFPGTVAENIACFAASYADAAVIRAAQRAGVHEQILEFGGYDQRVENLSGGRQQLVSLARAFYGEPVLLVLDEPTNHLDQDSKVRLMEAIAAACQEGMAVIMATHDQDMGRVSTHVLVVTDGAKERFGPVSEFIKNDAAVATPAE